MSNEIPKVIHYCWFGGKPLPKLAVKCIESWKKYLPDYEIKRWDETNFDVNAIAYTAQAYENKKYAFVSDYARFWILYHHGGLYFDTDVQVVKGMEDIVARGAFMGCENPASPDGDPKDLHVNPGLGLGVTAGHPFYKELLEFYSTLKFVKEDGSLNLDTVVDYTTGLLTKHGLRNSGEIQEVAGVWIYPWDYFCPMTPTLVLNLTENSRTIHLYSASWCSPGVRFRKKVKRMLGNNVIKVIQPVAVAVRKILKYLS